MRKRKNIIALTLTLTLVVCLAAVVPAAFAADTGVPADVPEDHPYYEGIRWCIDNNLMKPDANGSFRPDGILTVSDMWSAVLASYNPLGESGAHNYRINDQIRTRLRFMFPINVGGEMTRGQMLSYMYYYLSEDDSLRTADGPRYVRVNDLPPQTKWLRAPIETRRPDPSVRTKDEVEASWSTTDERIWNAQNASYKRIQNSWAANDDWFDIVGPVNDVKETDIADWDEITALEPIPPTWIWDLDPELWLSDTKPFPLSYDPETGAPNRTVGKRYFVNRYLDTVRDHGFVENRWSELHTDKESILYMYQLGLAVVQKDASGKIVCDATEPVTRGEFCQVLCNAGLKQETMGQFYNRFYDDWYRGVHDMSENAEPGYEVYRGEGIACIYPEKYAATYQKENGRVTTGNYDRSHKPFEAPVETRNKPPVIVTGFSDVKETDWFCNAVYWAVDRGITNGTSGTTFSPLDTCTRAQIITFLYRANGSPAVADESQRFSDASSSDWYYNAALWAAQNGLVTGTTFHPDQDATRADVVRYLYRLAGTPAVDGTGTFSDVPADDAELASAVAWAIGKGITNGTSENAFSPDKTCDRAEIVTFLFRAYK